MYFWLNHHCDALHAAKHVARWTLRGALRVEKQEREVKETYIREWWHQVGPQPM